MNKDKLDISQNNVEVIEVDDGILGGSLSIDGEKDKEFVVSAFETAMRSFDTYIDKHSEEENDKLKDQVFAVIEPSEVKNSF